MDDDYGGGNRGDRPAGGGGGASGASGAMPEAFDRQLGNLDGLPGALSIGPTIYQSADLLGVAATYIVRTVRQQDRVPTANPEKDAASSPRFTVFLEYYSKSEKIRLVIPPKVADLIARHRDRLTDRARSKAAKALAERRKEAGIVPGFLRGKAKARNRTRATRAKEKGQ
jgi:hypothetical protein